MRSPPFYLVYIYIYTNARSFLNKVWGKWPAAEAVAGVPALAGAWPRRNDVRYYVFNLIHVFFNEASMLA